MNPDASGLSGGAATGEVSGAWSRSRWWIVVLLVFAAHLGFVSAFGDRKPVQPRRALPVTVLNLTQSESEWLALNDPTLFALPTPRGAAGQVWSRTPVVTNVPYRWAEPPRLLELRTEDLGNAFGRFMQTNAFANLMFAAKPEPEAFLGSSRDTANSLATNSVVRLTGELVHRRWLNPPVLPVWTSTDLLTNTVVQALVQPDGSVFSVTLLVPPGPGTNEQSAAEYALALARGARFSPARDTNGMALGNLIFNWHTAPPP